MARAMCLELSQADLKAIGRSRGFEPETIGSRELLQHVLLSDQGVGLALAALTPAELACLHLLNCLREQVDVEFFKRLYPALVPPNIYASHNERFKALFQEVKARLVRRGLLLVGTLPETTLLRGLTILERRRFCLPETFGRLLSLPFPARQLDPATTGNHRSEVLRNKVGELLQPASASAGGPDRAQTGRWRIENGELRLGMSASRFRLEQLESWQRAQFEAAVGYTSKTQPEQLMPAPLLLYALSRLGENEWLVPSDLLPLWTMALRGVKAPEPHTVCEAGYEWGCVEKSEVDGAVIYRLPRLPDPQASRPPEDFLRTDTPQRVAVRLAQVPLAALERLCEVSRLELAEGQLWASPNLLKLSHARAETLADPVFLWLRGRHPAFCSAAEKIEQRRGKLIVHENLLVAQVKDLPLKVALEKQFGGPGKLTGLSGEFVAFPKALLPEIQSWMKKSGHVIKRVESGELPSQGRETEEDA